MATSTLSAKRAVLPQWDDIFLLRRTIALFTPWAWVIGLVAAALMLLAIGGTTAIFENDYFRRMTPVRTQDYFFWGVSAALVGLLAGTYVVSRAGEQLGKAVTGGFLADLAVGCPICNKVVVASIGTSGALTFFEPLQIVLGIMSVGFLAYALLFRARGIAGECSLPAALEQH